jgi:hypothetical protein
MLGWEVGAPQAPLEPLTDQQLGAVAAILDATEPQRLLRADANSPSTEVASVG